VEMSVTGVFDIWCRTMALQGTSLWYMTKLLLLLSPKVKGH